MAAGIDEIRPMFRVLAGRWLVERDASSDLIIIASTGAVTFVGEGDEEDLQLAEVLEAPGNFVLSDHNGEELCSLQFEEEASGRRLLHTKDANGVMEIWIQTASGEEEPTVTRQKSGSLTRRWTKESQAGAQLPEPDYHSEGAPAPPAFVLAGRWVAWRDGEAHGMVVITEVGTITFVGEDDEGDMYLAEQEHAPGNFVLVDNGEPLCSFRLEEHESGAASLHSDDGSEVWHKSAPAEPDDDESKVVARRKNSLIRRWTKDGQKGSTLENNAAEGGV